MQVLFSDSATAAMRPGVAGEGRAGAEPSQRSCPWWRTAQAVLEREALAGQAEWALTVCVLETVGKLAEPQLTHGF